MTVLAAVVGRSLPSAKGAPARLPSLGYQLLSVVAVGLAIASFAVFGLTLEGAAAAVFCLALVIVSAADLAYRLIPNRVVLPATAIVLVLMTAGEPSPEWALAAFGAGLALFALAFIYPAGMGMGDVKLALLMGAALGRGVSRRSCSRSCSRRFPRSASSSGTAAPARKWACPSGRSSRSAPSSCSF